MTLETNNHHLAKQVGSKERRRLRSLGEGKKRILFGMGMFGLVGWSVAIPTVLGVFLGVWLDQKTNTSVSWTITLLLGGVLLGCFNAWYWIKQESSLEEFNKGDE